MDSKGKELILFVCVLEALLVDILGKHVVCTLYMYNNSTHLSPGGIIILENWLLLFVHS